VHLRIVAGSLRGRNLKAPPAWDPTVRPTADRAREALFSILQRWPMGPFLDLFSGTGAVALEACSRGYGPVTCVEQDPTALACIKANAAGTDLQILSRDAHRLNGDAFPGQMVIFADPPYQETLEAWAALAPRLKGWLDPEGVLVWEAGQDTELPPAKGLVPLESRRYGQAVFHFFRRA
jgi:16S rRNA (guanine966-N2)-methyltransferase